MIHSWTQELIGSAVDVVDEKIMRKAALRRRRRKFTTSIQPAKAYEDESVIMSGPH